MKEQKKFYLQRNIKRKIILLPLRFKEALGYDLKVADEDATVEDWRSALNQFFLYGSYTRLWAKNKLDCLDCSLCCRDRIPLTSIDIYHMMSYLQEEKIETFFLKYVRVIFLGPAVDILLKTTKDGHCLFWEKEKGRCRIYPARPLVCQSFSCSPLSNRAKELREIIINVGEDEAVRLWAQHVFSKKTKRKNTSFDPANYPPTPFRGALSFKDVKIADVVSPEFRRILHN